MIWFVLTLGLVIGGTLGFFTAALMMAASKEPPKHEIINENGKLVLKRL